MYQSRAAHIFSYLISLFPKLGFSEKTNIDSLFILNQALLTVKVQKVIARSLKKFIFDSLRAFESELNLSVQNLSYNGKASL